MTPLDDAHLDRRRAESFGRVAEEYDRFRPAYPDALIVDLATRGGTDVLDVGCGTGIAARLLAARGLRVLGVEPDPAMAGVARRRGVTVEVAPFESWDDRGRRFDLLTSAQAWHWIDPDAGARKAATVLRPGGAVALMWNLAEVHPDQRAAVDEVYHRVVPEIDSRGRQRGGQPSPPILAGLAAAGFGPPRIREYPWEKTYATADWLAQVGTFSDHSLLPDDRRAELFTELAAAVGDTVRLRLDTVLVTAPAPG